MAEKKEKQYVSDNARLMAEWDWEKNNEFGLVPNTITLGSHKKAWWKCSKGHEWQASIAHRKNGRGCPICSLERRTSLPEYIILFYLEKYGIKAIHRYMEKGYELDIYIPLKNIAIEYDGNLWHKNKSKKDLEKNAKCKNDGIILYRLREGLQVLNDTSIDYIVDRNQKNLSEVVKKLLLEIIGANIEIDIERDFIQIENLREYTEKANSLLYTNPELAKEWNYEKNGDLKPEHFYASSNKKVWWKCTNEHEWIAAIVNRNKGRNCPYCSGNKVLKGFNDLLSLNPQLAKEWNYEKNAELRPEQVSPSSNKKVWWKCSKGHEWLAKIYARNSGTSCPYCFGRNAIKNENDLQTANPELANEWNYERNGELIPENFTANSHEKVWWKCSKGHEWTASIKNRNKGAGCPVCSGHKVLKEYNDLSTVNPSLSREWNYEKNGELSPENFTASSHEKVWWKCKNGHEWQARIADRSRGRNCPYCSGRKKLN